MQKSKGRCAVLLLCALGLVVMAPSVGATVLTFDDLKLPPGTLYAPLPQFYGGLEWSSGWDPVLMKYGVWYYINPAAYQAVYGPSGYSNGMVSSPIVAFNGYGDEVWTEDGTFNFQGAYFTAAWRDGLQLTVKGFLGTNQLYDKTVTLSATQPTFEEFDYNGIDRLDFSATGGTKHSGWYGGGDEFAMDNFGYTTGPVTSTILPEPMAMIFFGTGLVAVAGYVARRRMLRKV